MYISDFLKHIFSLPVISSQFCEEKFYSFNISNKNLFFSLFQQQLVWINPVLTWKKRAMLGADPTSVIIISSAHNPVLSTHDSDISHHHFISTYLYKTQPYEHKSLCYHICNQTSLCKHTAAMVPFLCTVLEL